MRSVLTLALVAGALAGQTLSAAATTILGPLTAEVFIQKPAAKETTNKNAPVQQKKMR